MKSLQRLFFIGLASMLVLTSCTTVKYLQISDGSKSDGTLTMMYEYGGFEKPVVQWEAAKQSAITKCKSWGYSGAEFFDVGTSICLQYNQYGCVRWRVTYKCQCTN